jgi:ribosomal protein S18 acetylase RimI-like enzyme
VAGFIRYDGDMTNPSLHLMHDGNKIGSTILRSRPYETYILWLSIKPRFRQQGWGYRLLQMIEEMSKSRLRIATEQTNIPAVNLYRKFGFAKEEPFDNYLMMYKEITHDHRIDKLANHRTFSERTIQKSNI